jgi:hypothetical protein
LVRSVEEAISDFGDGRGLGFGEILRQIPIRAWQRYTSRPVEDRAILGRPRHQADIIHGYMEYEARQILSARTDVQVSLPTMQEFFFDVFGRWRFRLHLLNDDFTIRHNPTKSGLEFVRQGSAQIDLGLYQEHTNLHLGYRLNSANSGLASVHIVCPKSEEAVAWHYVLLPPEDLPSPDQSLRPDGPRPRVRPGIATEEPRRTGESRA